MASQVPPKKGVAFSLGVSLYDSSGGLINSPTSAAAAVAYDFGAYQAMPSSDVVIADSTHGLIQIKLESSHMNYDAISVFVDDDTANCSPFTATIYTAANTLDDLSTRITAVSSIVSVSGVVVDSFTTSAYPYLGVIGKGTATAADSTSITVASSHALGTDIANAAVVYIPSDTGFGQSRSITDFGSNKASVDAWVTTPAPTAPYILFAAPPASAIDLPSVNVTKVSGAGVDLATAQFGVKVISIDTNALSAEAVSAGAVTKISSGLATSTEVSSGFAAQTAVLSTMAAALAQRATSTEVSSGFAAQTAALSTMANAILGVSTQVAAMSTATAGISEAVLNSTIDGAYTLRQVHRGYAAVLLGKVSGSSGAITVFRDINDVTDRVTAGVDTSGNRSTIVLVLT